MARRKVRSHLEGLWEFPGGKLELHESPEEALGRELKEELGIVVQVGRILDVVYHRYRDEDVLLLFYSRELIEAESRPLEVDEVAWVPKSKLQSLRWVPADAAFVRRLAAAVDPTAEG